VQVHGRGQAQAALQPAVLSGRVRLGVPDDLRPPT
jgi:hypothetical protein